MKLLHELEESKGLFEIIADDMGIEPYLVEKDYWIMHALWGLQQQGFDFELKGGTSLSKGFKFIDRFSEDIDIKIKPDPKKKVPEGRNHDRPNHVAKRKAYFDDLAMEINIPGMIAERDTEFDDKDFRSAGIRLKYQSLFTSVAGIKEGILLEVGFDTTTPNESANIDSWAYERALSVGITFTNNIAVGAKCYLPEYTFVEKLQAITKKVRQQQETGEFGTNFLRHFYDIHELFKQERVKNFIGTKEYHAHKQERFRGADEKDLAVNLAFNLDKDPHLFEEYKQEFSTIRSLFISGFPSFDEIYSSIIEIRGIG